MLPEKHREAALAKVEELRSVGLFEGLPQAALARLQAIARVITANQDEVLCRQGTMPECLYILLEGQVALSSTATDGTAAVVEVIRPGGHFVLASVLAELPYLMSGYSVGRSRLLAIDSVGLLQLVEEDPLLSVTLLRSVSREFRNMVRQVRDLKLRTAAQRLGCYLLALVSDAEAAKAEFRLPFEKGLLAARLGCRQENLSRAFATLRDYGVETHGARVILHNIPKLKAFAVPDDDLSELETV